MECENLDNSQNVAEKSKNSIFYSYINPIRVPVEWMGFFFLDRIEGRFKRFFSVLHTLYLFVIGCFMLYFIIDLASPLVQKDTKFDQNYIQSMIQAFWFSNSFVCFCFLMYWSKKRVLELVFKKLIDATQDGNLDKVCRRFKITYIVSFGFVLVIIIVQQFHALDVIFKIFGVFPFLDSFDSAMFKKDTTLSVIGMLVFFYYTMSWGFATLLYGCLCNCFQSSYTSLNRNFRNELLVDKNVLDGYITTYNKLRCMVHYANETFGGYILLVLFFNICLVVIDLYNLLRFQHAYMELVVVGFWFSVSLMQVWSTSWLPAMVNAEIGKLGELMFMKLYENGIDSDSDLFRKVSSFVLRNINSSVGIEAGGIFYVTKGVLLTVTLVQHWLFSDNSLLGVAIYLIIIIVLLATVVAAPAASSSGSAPPYSGGEVPNFDYAYSETTGLGTARVGAYWPLGEKLAGFAGSGQTAPPTGVLITQSEVFVVDGVPDAGSSATTPAATTVAAPNGTSAQQSTVVQLSGSALRFTGANGSCVEMSGFTASQDSCLFDPGTCSLTDGNNNNAVGLSLSMWVNLPAAYASMWLNVDDQTAAAVKAAGTYAYVGDGPYNPPVPQYLLDTGGDENGGKGVKIYLVDSLQETKRNGKNYNLALVVLVSTGDQFWKTMITGMLTPYEWNNVGFRWSPTVATNDNAPYGLQVFVNKTSVAWKRLSTKTKVAAAADKSLTGKSMTLGCKQDYSGGVVGRVQHVAAWYWNLRNDPDPQNVPKFQQPDGTNGWNGELDYLDGGLGPSNRLCYDESVCLPGYTAGYYQPPLYYATTPASPSNMDPSEEDTVPAAVGDCPMTSSNPMTCADTVAEMTQAAVSPTYTGNQFTYAAIRTANKAGPKGLSENDTDQLLYLILNYGAPLLTKESALPAALGAAQIYMDLAHVVSKLTESIYQSEWMQIHKDGLAGLTVWTQLLDDWLMQIVPKIGVSSGIVRDANETVVMVASQTASLWGAAGGPMTFPKYTDPNLTFTTTRASTWGSYVRDQVVLPMEAFVGWDSTTQVNVVAKLYNEYDESLPGKLSSQISGTGSATFYVNSRIVSLTVSPPMVAPNILNQYPIQYTVALKEPQDDRPYRKGAILCVAWIYKYGTNLLGSWDTYGCQQVSINDTHAVCSCNHTTDYAILTEDYTPPGLVSNGGYMACFAFYIISLICLFVFIVTFLRRSDLHYEIHTIHFNMAFAMFMALIFYLSTWSAYTNRVSCIVVSVFLHFFYTATYAWFCLAAHYVFRAITSGKLTGIMLKYCIIGWLLPGLLVCVMAGLNVESYGIGVRCLATVYNYYMYVYIGSYVFFCVMVFPLLCIAVCNLNKNGVKNTFDWDDLKHGLIGIFVIWPLIFLTWLMAMFIYVIPQNTQAVDFLFEFFNSLQGILVLIFLGLMIPTFRDGLLCKKPREVPIFDENGQIIDKAKRHRTYYN